MCKEGVLDYFEVLPWNYQDGTEKPTRNFNNILPRLVTALVSRD